MSELWREVDLHAATGCRAMRVLRRADCGPAQVCGSDSHAGRSAPVFDYSTTSELKSEAVAFVEMVCAQRSQTLRGTRSHSRDLSSLLDVRHQHHHRLHRSEEHTC